MTAIKDNLAVALKLKRNNQTSIDYEIEMVEFGKNKLTKKGTVNLSHAFFLAGETDTNDTTGNSYFSTPYSVENDSCYTYIRIGEEKERPYLSGKIILNCNGKIKDIDLDNFPTLIEKQ